MARQETFYQRPLDRTPYGACVWVGIVLAVLLTASVIGLWKAASYFKHNVRIEKNAELPKLDTDRTLNDIQQQVQNQIDQKQNQAAEAAEKAAKEAIEKEIEKQKSQFTQ